MGAGAAGLGRRQGRHPRDPHGPAGGGRPEDRAPESKSWPDGQEIGHGQATTKFKPDADPLGGVPTMVEVPMPGFKPWTHEECNLYTATVQLLRGGKVLDEVSFRFGMRDIKVADRRFQLNGRNLFLRGSDWVGEWMWPHIDLRGKEKDYIVTEAREMSINSFRTHTLPPPRLGPTSAMRTAR